MHPHSKTRQRVVYLPGIDGTGRLLYRQRRLFEEYDVRCVSYPQQRPNSYAQLADLGQEQLAPEGGIVLAESFGGGVALTLSLRRPDLVRQLVLVNTFAFFPRQPLIHLLAIFGKYLPHRPASFRSRGLRSRFFFPPSISKTEQETWWDQSGDVPMSAYGMRLELIANLDLRTRLQEICIPALVFVSPNDRVVPPLAGRLLAKRLPKSKLIEIAAGHAAMIDPRVDIGEMLAQMDSGAIGQQPQSPVL